MLWHALCAFSVTRPTSSAPPKKSERGLRQNTKMYAANIVLAEDSTLRQGPLSWGYGLPQFSCFRKGTGQGCIRTADNHRSPPLDPPDLDFIAGKMKFYCLRQCTSKRGCQSVRQASSQSDKNTHFGFFVSGNTAPSSGENKCRQPPTFWAAVRTLVRPTRQRRRRRRPPTRIRTADQKVCGWVRYHSTKGECDIKVSPIAWSLLSKNF